MNNQNKTNDSLFTEIEPDEAANVNGGNHNGYYFPGWTYYFQTYPNRYTYTQPTFNSLGDVDRRVGGILSTLRWL